MLSCLIRHNLQTPDWGRTNEVKRLKSHPAITLSSTPHHLMHLSVSSLHALLSATCHHTLSSSRHTLPCLLPCHTTVSSDIPPIPPSLPNLLSCLCYNPQTEAIITTLRKTVIQNETHLLFCSFHWFVSQQGNRQDHFNACVLFEICLRSLYVSLVFRHTCWGQHSQSIEL